MRVVLVLPLVVVCLLGWVLVSALLVVLVHWGLVSGCLWFSCWRCCWCSWCSFCFSALGAVAPFASPPSAPLAAVDAEEEYFCEFETPPTTIAGTQDSDEAVAEVGLLAAVDMCVMEAWNTSSGATIMPGA